MKADDARKRSESAKTPRESYVNSIVGAWHRAINLAADKGEFSVRQSKCAEVDGTSREHEAARAKLKDEGYNFNIVGTGPNESEWECSW